MMMMDSSFLFFISSQIIARWGWFILVMCCVIFFCIPTKQPFIQVGPACFFSSSSSYIFSLSFDDWRWLRPSGRGGPRETLPEQSSFALHFPRLWILFFSFYIYIFFYIVSICMTGTKSKTKSFLFWPLRTYVVLVLSFYLFLGMRLTPEVVCIWMPAELEG